MGEYKIVNDTIENANNLYNIIVDRGMSGEEVFGLFTDWHGYSLVTRAMCENLRDCEGFDEFEDDEDEFEDEFEDEDDENEDDEWCDEYFEDVINNGRNIKMENFTGCGISEDWTLDDCEAKCEKYYSCYAVTLANDVLVAYENRK